MTFALDPASGHAVATCAVGELRVLGALGMRVVTSGFHMDEGPELAWVNPYRLLAKGRLLGYGRTTEPSSFTVDGGEAVVVWEAFGDHPLRMEVRTRLVDESTIDTTFSVRAEERVEDYEILVSSYFTPHQAALFHVRTHPFLPDTEWFRKEGRQFEPTSWPRDEHGAGMLFDGRWSTGHPPLWWVPGSFYASPLLLEVHRWAGLAMATMGRRADVACISGLSGYHNSQYLHLFGRTLDTGEEASTVVRTLLFWEGRHEAAQERAEAAYAAFDAG